MTPMPSNPSRRLTYEAKTLGHTITIEATLDFNPLEGGHEVVSKAVLHTDRSPFRLEVSVATTTTTEPMMLAEAILGCTARAERIAADPKVVKAVAAYRVAMPCGPL